MQKKTPFALMISIFIGGFLLTYVYLLFTQKPQPTSSDSTPIRADQMVGPLVQLVGDSAMPSMCLTDMKNKPIVPADAEIYCRYCINNISRMLEIAELVQPSSKLPFPIQTLSESDKKELDIDTKEKALECRAIYAKIQGIDLHR